MRERPKRETPTKNNIKKTPKEVKFWTYSVRVVCWIIPIFTFLYFQYIKGNSGAFSICLFILFIINPNIQNQKIMV